MVVVVVVVVVLRSHVCPFQLAQHPRTSSTPHLTDPIINQTQSLHNCQTHSGQHLRVIVSPDAQLKSVVATLSQEMLRKQLHQDECRILHLIPSVCSQRQGACQDAVSLGSSCL